MTYNETFLAELLERFNKYYDDFYNGKYTAENMGNACDITDIFFCQSKLLQAFAEYRGDFLSSDRELAAYSMACVSFIDELTF